MKFSAVLIGVVYISLIGLGCRSSAIEASSSWKHALTPDSALQFRVPPDYRQRNTYGCWDRSDGYWPALRDFCLEFTSSAKAESEAQAWMVPCKEETGVFDGACHSEPHVDTVQYHGRSIIVLRAFLSGTIGHYDRLSAVLIRIPLGVAGTAVLDGTYRGEGVPEFVAIAGTVHLIEPQP